MVILSGMATISEFPALQRLDEKRNMARFYTIWLQSDLFGRTSLMCAWGRIGSTGQVRSISFPERQPALDTGATIMRRKRAKGYLPVETMPGPDRS